MAVQQANQRRGIISHKLAETKTTWVTVLKLDKDQCDVIIDNNWMYLLSSEKFKFICDQGIEWTAEKSYDTLTVTVAVKFSQAAAVEYLMRWR